MWSRRYLVIVVAFVVCAAGFAEAGLALGHKKNNVRHAAEDFYVALNAMLDGDAEPMMGIWSQKKDVTYMGPTGGMTVGWEAVSEQWRKEAEMELGGTVSAEDFNVIVHGDLAVVSNWEVGETTNADGKTIPVRVRATNSFRREGGEWKMIGHHVDLLPDLAR